MVFNTFSFEAKMEEKIRVYITGFLNFEKITELPLAGSSTSRLPALGLRAASVRRRGHLSRHASGPQQNCPHAHRLSRNPSALAFSPRDACPCHLSARHAAKRRRCRPSTASALPDPKSTSPGCAFALSRSNAAYKMSP